jgi:hypothetical protein
MDCPDVTIWIRTNKPEIWSGLAIPMNHTSNAGNTGTICSWQLAFTPTIAGEYTVDNKLLLFCGTTPVGMHNCIVHSNTDVARTDFTTFEQDYLSTASSRTTSTNQQQQQYSYHHEFVGFKLWFPYQACCEVCARQAQLRVTNESTCMYWSTPSSTSTWVGMELSCELYYGTSSSTPQQHGRTLLRQPRHPQHFQHFPTITLQ